MLASLASKVLSTRKKKLSLNVFQSPCVNSQPLSCLGLALQSKELCLADPCPSEKTRGEEKRLDRCLLSPSKSPTVGTFLLDIDFCLIE